MDNKNKEIPCDNCVYMEMCEKPDPDCPLYIKKLEEVK